ncbi:MAG: lipopolysaccharide transport periplasmic protein LptA [Burkholderiales bacterium]|nr:lipopolysaccharide transport periplasmic protein LptA [Burkholderiales bacterium]
MSAASRAQRAAAAIALVACAGFVAAERADRDKPTHIEAARMSADEARRMSVFEGNVVLTKGTIRVQADRIVVRQDADGYQYATATGNPVRFRQKSDPRGDREGVWTEGEALRVEIDDRRQMIELFERARVRRDQDEVQGEYIALDQRTEFFSASAAKGAAGRPEGRVRAVIQPRQKPEPEPPAPPPGAR